MTEQALLGDVQRGRDLLQAVVEGSGDLIFARDTANRLVLANRASAALFGFASGAEAVGHRLDASLSTGAAALAGAGPGRVATVDGRLFEVGHSALRSPDGAVIGTISIARDVTQRVAAESRLQRLQSDLARAGRLSAVAAMGAGLAHELHQPLSAAANFLAVAMRRLAGAAAGPDGTAPAAAAMAEASAQVLRTGEIVKRLRGFIGEAAMQRVALAPLVREAADAAWRHSGHPGSRLQFELDEALEALVDPVSIQQVVSNLVRNAAEAVDWRGRRHRVGGAGAAADGSALVSVMDSGRGLDARRRSGCSTCSAAAPSRAGSASGWRSAAPSCRRMAAGSLPPTMPAAAPRSCSRCRRGRPRLEPPMAGARAGWRACRTAGAPEQPALIYVADDDDGVRRSLEMLLDGAGYRVAAFASGEAMLAALDAGAAPACCRGGRAHG